MEHDGDEEFEALNQISEKKGKRKRDNAALRKAPQAPKRFKSSYICFFMAKQPEIKEELGENASVAAISKRSAELWYVRPQIFICVAQILLVVGHAIAHEFTLPYFPLHLLQEESLSRGPGALGRSCCKRQAEVYGGKVHLHRPVASAVEARQKGSVGAEAPNVSVSLLFTGKTNKNKK